MTKKRQRFTHLVLSRLPQSIRLGAIRKNAKIDSKWPSSSLEIKIAASEHELADAYRLLHDSYVESGFSDPDPSGLRVLAQHLLPQTTTIIAKWNGEVIGTLSLIRDNLLGLPMEKIFNLSPRRLGGRRLAEVSSLAIDPRYRGHAKQALFPLFRFVYQYARHYFGTHELVIAVHPKMMDMYTGFMCFEKLNSEPKAYDFVKGAAAVGLFLDFESFDSRAIKTFGSRPENQNFHKYWNEVPTHPNNKLPQRDYHSAVDPILTPQLLEKFFLGKAGLSKRLSFHEVQILLATYPFKAYEKLLKPLQSFSMRKYVRMETHMKVELTSKKISGEVWNVSTEGLMLRIQKGSLRLNGKTRLQVWLNKIHSSCLDVEVRWCQKTSLYGLKILRSNADWIRMIDSLKSSYENSSHQSMPILQLG